MNVVSVEELLLWVGLGYGDCWFEPWRRRLMFQKVCFLVCVGDGRAFVFVDVRARSCWFMWMGCSPSEIRN